MDRFLSIDNKKIEYKWYGRGKEKYPVLVFLHEGLGCVDLWKDFPKILSRKTQCRAFAYSRLGYGRSHCSSLPWKLTSFENEARQLLPKVLEEAGIKEYIIIGHSDGGSIGLIHGAGKSLGLKGIITEAAHLFCEPITIEGIRQAKKAYETGRLKDRLKKYHGTNTDNAFYGWSSAWLSPGSIHWNIERYISNIKVPLLAIQGKDDEYGTMAQLDAFKKLGINSVTCPIDNCGHIPHFEKPEQILSLMSGFILSILERNQIE